MNMDVSSLFPMLALFLASCDDNESFIKGDAMRQSVCLFVHMVWCMTLGARWKDVWALVFPHASSLAEPDADLSIVEGTPCHQPCLILQAPLAIQNRMEFFVTHLTQMPAHRLRISFGHVLVDAGREVGAFDKDTRSFPGCSHEAVLSLRSEPQDCEPFTPKGSKCLGPNRSAT